MEGLVFVLLIGVLAVLLAAICHIVMSRLAGDTTFVAWIDRLIYPREHLVFKLNPSVHRNI